MIDNSDALNFRRMRMALGYLGLILPFVLLIYTWVDAKYLDGSGLLPSISDYYFTYIGDVFVGIMWVIGFFLLMYQGHPPTQYEKQSPRWIDKINDRHVSIFAGIGAVGVGLFPLRAPICGENCPEYTGLNFASSGLHFFCAWMFFISTAIFCLVLFTRGSGTQNNFVGTDANRVRRIYWCGRNMYFIICGIIITICKFTIFGYFILSQMGFDDLIVALDGYSFVFWIEVIAILAFAQAWLEKAKSSMSIGRIVRS